MLSFNRLSFTFRIAACLSLVLASGIGTSVYGQSEWPTALVTINTTGTGGGNGDSSFWSMSANGRYVLFTTDATDVSDSKLTDVFVRDLETGTNIPADVNEKGKGGFGAVGGTLSSTGRYLAFTSFATDLVPTPDNNHRT